MPRSLRTVAIPQVMAAAVLGKQVFFGGHGHKVCELGLSAIVVGHSHQTPWRSATSVVHSPRVIAPCAN